MIVTLLITVADAVAARPLREYEECGCEATPAMHELLLLLSRDPVAFFYWSGGSVGGGPDWPLLNSWGQRTLRYLPPLTRLVETKATPQ